MNTTSWEAISYIYFADGVVSAAEATEYKTS